MVPYIQSTHEDNMRLTVYLDGVPFNITSAHMNYTCIYDYLTLGGDDVEYVRELIDEEKAIQDKVAEYDDITVSDGEVTYKGETVTGYLTDMMVRLLNRGTDIAPWAKFLRKLQKNPAKHAVDELYQWMEKAKMPLMPNGNFLAYKKVQDDYSSSHRNADGSTFWNFLGTKVKMPRNKVDDDRNRTCSSGLHFCSYEYLPQYMGTRGKVLLLEINPKNVVSIPTDYDFTKGRASAYKIVGELTLEEAKFAFPSADVVDRSEYDWFADDDYAADVEEAVSQGTEDAAYDFENGEDFDPYNHYFDCEAAIAYEKSYTETFETLEG